MAAAGDDLLGVGPLKLDFDILKASYLSQTITYYDVVNLEKHHLTEASGGLNASGSSDSSHLMQWVTVADWHDLAYQELLSMNKKCLRGLVVIEARVEGLLSQCSESADKYEPLKILLGEFLKFLALSKEDLFCLSKNKCYMLMTLLKSFVGQIEDPLSSYEYGKNLCSLFGLYQIPELQKQMIIKVLCANPSLRSESAFSDSVCQSEWVRLDDWHNLAHRELTSIRRVYLPQLFKAYERVCGLWSKNPKSRTKYLPVKIFLLEYCKFLTLSRAEIVGLSKGECYVFMMIIKNQLWQQLLPTGSQSRIPVLHDELDIRVEFVEPTLGREPVTSDHLHEIQPQWVVLAHQELESMRNVYSAKLDKIYKEVFDLCFQNPLSESKSNHSLRAAVENALSFLALSRANIYDFSEKMFNNYKRLVKETVLVLFPEDQCAELHSRCRQSKRLMNSHVTRRNGNMRLFKAIVLPQSGKLPPNFICQGNPSLRNEASMDSSRLIQFERFTNLNDRLFEELQLMRKKYMPVLLRTYFVLTRLDAKSGKHEGARYGLAGCFRFLEMPRCLFAVITRNFYEEQVEQVKSVLAWCTTRRVPADYYPIIEQPSFGYREVKRNLDEVN